ncbi:carbohydrate ABC transporter permease [Streptomyces sp. NPDC047917]|uniref:carbohydrate ABC transporter permease n=1 Tax=Streptomyces sp. NPDC047917 TaxID=3365491 RepID=UPI00371557BD
MSTLTTTSGADPGPHAPAAAVRTPRRPRGPRREGRQGIWGWIFISPMVAVLGLFLALPVVMALWVSLLNWDGQSNPFSGAADFVGLDNYKGLFTDQGLTRTLFMTSMRNNLYYVLLVVPLQTALALGLALAVNQRRLKGKGAFRTAFYFPSVTSSIAVSTVFLFLFQSSGAVNNLLKWVGIQGPNWFTDPRGLVWVSLSGIGLVDPATPPSALADHGVLGLSWWDWLSGPSIAMCTIILLVVWTTSGTFMLMFLAALQDIPEAQLESARLDGANRRQTLRHVILPALRPILFLVITLGLIGTWQVFDQVYVMSQGQPANTTLTPAFLSYSLSFKDAQYGTGAAISFVLLAIILVMTGIQRLVLRDSDGRGRRRTRRTSR